ncbi:MAG TPA: alkylhydroperoxidase [Gammaproteobacteria bacterium]|nr:alkylhydroperoxidase [Gammaproteobacteria bacterium]
MTRLSPLDINTADQPTRTTLKAIETKLGMLPNLLATMAHSPATLNGYLALSNTLAQGSLTARQRELIAIAVAQENGCEYCLSAHAAAASSLGIDAAAIARARAGFSEDALDSAMLAFAVAVVKENGVLNDQQIEAARQQGLSNGRILEVVTNVALNILTNYINLIADTEIDFPQLSLWDADPDAALTAAS